MRRMKSDCPPRTQPTPCWQCQFYAGMTPGAYGLCRRPNASKVKASPETGCAFWSREPGVDDFVPIEWVEHERAMERLRPQWEAMMFRGTARPRMPPAQALKPVRRRGDDAAAAMALA
jgi:hypothetical protein